MVYTALTGKACNVLQQKGNKNVSTLHHLLYKYRPLKNGGFKKIPRDVIDYDVVVVDECSMVPKWLIQQLAVHQGIYVLILGDVFQIPNIYPDEDNHLLDSPHVFLNEVHRQALESDIIKVSMDIRNNQPLAPYRGKDIQIFNNSDLTEGMLLWADQIISATNATRMEINKIMRQLLGYSGEPQEGEKVICLKNEWDIFDNQGNPLVNGTIGYLKNIYTQTFIYPKSICGGGSLEVIRADMTTEIGTTFRDLIIDKQGFLTGNLSLSPKVQHSLKRSKELNWMVPQLFTYGYCVSCHKFQGSQADKILVLEEKFPFEHEEHQRWLYTACTRAAQKCVIIKK